MICAVGDLCTNAFVKWSTLGGLQLLFGGVLESAPGRGGRPASAAAEVEVEDEDPEEFATAPTVEDHQSAAVDRLLQTFPGATEADE